MLNLGKPLIVNKAKIHKRFSDKWFGPGVASRRAAKQIVAYNIMCYTMPSYYIQLINQELYVH